MRPPMKGKTMLNTTKNAALFILDAADMLGPLLMFCTLFFLVGLGSY
jgi:hypothetical protein